MAEMVPVEFWGWAISQVKAQYPDILFIAEVYKPAEYRNFLCNGKFDYLYDKVGLYDMLRNISSKNYPVREITNSWQALGGIENQMLNFLENHDEQRIGSGFFSGNGMFVQPAMIVAATLTQAPVMIYCGQELNELGMDSEGFSGVDGRTTIFDYWGVKSIQAWTNNGKFDGQHLTPLQKELRAFYQKLLNVTLSEKAITDGLMYDLEFANFDNPKFNSHEQFAYLRKYEDEILLFVLNFDDKDLDTDIMFPLEAFQFLDLEEGNRFDCVNLLDKTEIHKSISLSSKQTFNIQMPAWKGKIIKLKQVK